MEICTRMWSCSKTAGKVRFFTGVTSRRPFLQRRYGDASGAWCVRSKLCEKLNKALIWIQTRFICLWKNREGQGDWKLPLLLGLFESEQSVTNDEDLREGRYENDSQNCSKVSEGGIWDAGRQRWGWACGVNSSNIVLHHALYSRRKVLTKRHNAGSWMDDKKQQRTAFIFFAGNITNIA